MAKEQVLIRNTSYLGSDITEKQLLNEWPRGAYTTARTVGANKVLEFELHVNRLVDSARLMIEAAKATPPSNIENITDASKLRPYLVRSIASALRHFHEHFPNCHTERRITCLLSWEKAAETADADWPSEFELYSHVHVLPNRPKPPIRVDIRGAPRGNAKAKDTQWVKDRKALEAMMGPEVNEVILKDDEGHLMEGTQTNFFAILNGTVFTAGDGVLEGSIRKMVLEECQRTGIPVALTPPHVKDMQAWEGAFISSTSRLALPIDVIHWPDGPSGEEVRRFTDQPLTHRIVQLVMEKLEQDSVLIEGAPVVSLEG